MMRVRQSSRLDGLLVGVAWVGAPAGSGHAPLESGDALHDMSEGVDLGGDALHIALQHLHVTLQLADIEPPGNSVYSGSGRIRAHALAASRPGPLPRMRPASVLVCPPGPDRARAA